ncbi:hypothetical protein [Candidatus Ruthturnera calyptogenae]|nr:hypothetical protein [Candidatus Ruthturnera calyptogenae]
MGIKTQANSDSSSKIISIKTKRKVTLGPIYPYAKHQPTKLR